MVLLCLCTMARGSRSSRGTTIREGTGERNWYALAGYVAFSVIGLAYIIWNVYQFGAAVGGIAIAVVLLALAVFALVTFPALFKDSAYLRGTDAGWNPKWWLYLGIPVMIPVGIYITGEVFNDPFVGGGAAILAFPIITAVSNACYLYQRHRYVGVP